MSSPPRPDPSAGQPGWEGIILATGGSVAAGRIDHLDYHEAPHLVSWPVRVGQVPGLASAFQDRPGLREQVQSARSRSGQVILTQVLSGGGGVGKSQLAASYAHAALRDGTDLVVWADAGSTATVIHAFARAAARVQADGATGIDAETDARAFLDWAAATSRTWLVVLDDINDPADLASWWPSSPTGAGWTLGTTRRRDAALTGAGRVMIDVGTYTRAESLTYLAERLTAAGRPELVDAQADALAGELGDLPLALSHAAAYMLDQQSGCTAYLDRYRAGRDRLEELMPATADADGYGRTVNATLLLALDAANDCAPVGLARPAIHLAAMFDPDGHPAELWTTDAATAYLTAHRGGPHPVPVTPGQARQALLLLHRYALVSFDAQAGPRAVRVHALTARAACESITAASGPAPARAAADALSAIWPHPDETSPALAESLRANASHAARHAGDILWCPRPHPVLFRVGTSLLGAGLYNEAIGYWHQASADAARLLGPEHHDTLTARSQLGRSYTKLGRADEAIPVLEQVAADFARLLGPEHLNTLAARADLASSYEEMRTDEAIAILEEVAADFARRLGPEHPNTLETRSRLANSYRQAGRTDVAIAILEQVAADFARVKGSEHPSTLHVREALADSYHQAGRASEANAMMKQLAADRRRLLGPQHIRTVITAAKTYTLGLPGLAGEPITMGELYAEMQRARLQGSPHPNVESAIDALRSPKALSSPKRRTFWGRRKQHQSADARMSDLSPRSRSDERAVEHAEGGDSLIRQGRYADAEEAYRAALVLAPRLARAYAGLGHALRGLRRHEEAEEACREALQLDPGLAPAYAGLALSLGGLKQYEKAETASREAMRLDPAYAGGHRALGSVLTFRKRYPEAEVALREAIRLDPASAEVHGSFGTFLTVQQRHVEAETAFREAIRLAPAYAQAHGGLGFLLTLRERYPEAETALLEAIRFDPTWAPAQFGIGLLYKSMKRYAGSEAALREAIRLDPNLADAHRELGLVMLSLSRYPEAEAAFREVIRLDPGLAVAHNNLGVAFKNMKRYPEAEAAYREAIRLKPDLALAHKNLSDLLARLNRHQ